MLILGYLKKKMESLIFKRNVVEDFNFYTFPHVEMDTWSLPVCLDLEDTTMLSLQHRHRSSTISVDPDMDDVSTICVDPDKDDVLTC